MSRPKPPFVWPRYERITEIDIVGPEIVCVRLIDPGMAGSEIVYIRLIDPDRIVSDPDACARYGFSQSHLDRMTIAGEAPEAVRIGTRQKGRFASAWYAWEEKRRIRRNPPALPAPAEPANETHVSHLEPLEAAPPVKPRRGRPRKAARIPAELEVTKRKPGRPRKVQAPPPGKRPRGRPRKVQSVLIGESPAE